MTPGEHFVILGNPENRRVTGFQSALHAQGFAPATVVSWLDFLHGKALPDVRARLRTDSFGENMEVQRMLLARGGMPDALTLEERHGEIVSPAIAHRGLLSALDELTAQLAERRGLLALNPPSDIAELFDKRRASRRFQEAGLAVPERLDDVPLEPDALIARLQARHWRHAYVKLASGSSASCLARVTLRPQVAVITTLEWDAPRWFNNRKVRTLRRPGDIDRALRFILSQEAHVERGLTKARIGGLNFDCRVLCIAGAPAFAVMRQSRLPITNLHLGGQRGDLTQLISSMPERAWHAAMTTCAQVAALYDSLHVGIDLMFEPDFHRHRVLEANAFGDLLPHLTRGGLSVYEWQIRAATGRSLPDVPIDTR